MTRTHSLAAALLLTLPPSVAPAADSRPIEQFQAVSVSLDTARSWPVAITVERWAPDSEREALAATLREGGPERMADTLMRIRPRAGTMRAPFWPSEVKGDLDLSYASQAPAPDGGRDVVLATSRHVTFAKAGNGTRATRYEVTVIEIHLDKDGKGEGKMVPAAKVSWDAKAKRIDVGNYSKLPVDLVRVTAKKG